MARCHLAQLTILVYVWIFPKVFQASVVRKFTRYMILDARKLQVSSFQAQHNG